MIIICIQERQSKQLVDWFNEFTLLVTADVFVKLLWELLKG